MRKTSLFFALLAFAVILLDQVSKYFLAGSLEIHQSVPVIPGFFSLVHVRNKGMAFGLMNQAGEGANCFLIAAAITAMVVIVFWFRKLEEEAPRVSVGLGLILGGAAGNLVDRFRMGEVLDFLDFYVGPHHWPAFNVADSAITIGTLWLALGILVFPPKKPAGSSRN